MRGIFWNTDGLGDRGKHIAIHELVREHKLDFIALLETGRSNFSASFLNFLAGGSITSGFAYPHMADLGGF